jgi:hypothetical protein
VKNCPGGLGRARIFLARIVAQVSQFGEGILLNVGWVEVVGGLGDAAELNEGLRGVKVTKHVEAAWLKKVVFSYFQTSSDFREQYPFKVVRLPDYNYFSAFMKTLA